MFATAGLTAAQVAQRFSTMQGRLTQGLTNWAANNPSQHRWDDLLGRPCLGAEIVAAQRVAAAVSHQHTCWLWVWMCVLGSLSPYASPRACRMAVSADCCMAHA